MCNRTKNVNIGANLFPNVCRCSILRRPHECCHPCLDVPVLWPGFVRAEDPEVPVVEEVPDHHPDGKMLSRHVTAVSCRPERDCAFARLFGDDDVEKIEHLAVCVVTDLRVMQVWLLLLLFLFFLNVTTADVRGVF